MGQPRFTHLDDLPWQEVRKQRHGDRTASVREKWMEFSPKYLSLYAAWDPGMIVHAHGHFSNHVVFVISGEMRCGDVQCPAGTHIALDQGDTFGPFIAGPEGVVLLEIMMGDPRSFPVDPDGYKRLLAERGVEQIAQSPDRHAKMAQGHAQLTRVRAAGTGKIMSEASARRLVLYDPATGAVLSPWRGWAAAIVMVFGTSFMSLVVVALSPVLPEIAAHFGQGRDGKFVAQLIQVAPSIGIILGAPASGWMVERAGSRPFLLTILTLFGLAGSAGLYLDNIWTLVASRLLLGIAAAGIVTATLFMIGEYFDAEGRARVLGYQSAVGAAAAMATILVAGQIADFGGWRAPFAIYLVAFPLVVVAAFAIPAAPPRRHGPKQAGDRSSIVSLLPLLALIVALFVGSYMSTIQMSFLLAGDGVIKPSTQSFVIFAGALMVTAGSAFYGAIRLRLGDRWTLRLCGALLGVGIVTMGLGHVVPLVALGCAISGIGIGIMNPQVNNMLIAGAPQNARGRAVGLGYTARYLGNFLNPVAVHPLAVAFGIHAAFVIVGALFLAGASVDSVQKRRAVAQ